ncbi:MAG: dCMP deaminase family protein [Candidatus Nanoarchaeia archaeon]|nr:dCMP deaminase family protein [Candidatus Nanoarchaeia archaeon]
MGEEAYKRPEWDEYFLQIARDVSKRATCLRRRYGAVVVKDKRIVSTGYCGAPSGQEDCAARGVCQRQEQNVPSGQRYELCRSVHAEANALQYAGIQSKGAVLYICGEEYDGSLAEGKPCSMCARMILNSHVDKVIVRMKDGTKKQFSIEEIKQIADSFGNSP